MGKQEHVFIVPLEFCKVTLKQEGAGCWTWRAEQDEEPWASGVLMGPTDPAVAKARIEARMWRMHDDEDNVEDITARVRRVIEDLERYAAHDEEVARIEAERFLKGRAKGYRNAAGKLRREVLKEESDDETTQG